MKNIERGSIKHLVTQIVSLIIAAMIIYPLFDFIWCKLINHTTFSYSVFDHIIEPIIFGVICGTVMWILEKRKK